MGIGKHVKRLPRYKKKCRGCSKFKFIKPTWSYCMCCYERMYGTYEGEDRDMYVEQNKMLTMEMKPLRPF